MDAHSHHDRTEAATPRRREQAREEGQVAHSPDLTAAVVIFLAAILLRTAGPFVGSSLQAALREALGSVRGHELNRVGAGLLGRWLAVESLLLCGGCVLVLMSVGLLVNGLQVGLRITPQALAIKWERLSPSSGWSKLMSLDGVVRALSLLVKLVLAASVAYLVLRSRGNELFRGGGGSLEHSIHVAWDVAASVAIGVSIAGLAWAGADFLYRWWRHEQQLRMSKQEIKEETKREDGDPQVRGRIKAAHRQALQRKSLRDVPGATVVVTNPTHIAVALKYELGQAGAPRVVAKGKGAFAQRIMQLARENGVPVQEAKPLARALYKRVAVGQEIPFELFHIVAEILTRLYRRRQAG
jgi:flagellar biosynthetic protein FlhB